MESWNIGQWQPCSLAIMPPVSMSIRPHLRRPIPTSGSMTIMGSWNMCLIHVSHDRRRMGIGLMEQGNHGTWKHVGGRAGHLGPGGRLVPAWVGAGGKAACRRRSRKVEGAGAWQRGWRMVGRQELDRGRAEEWGRVAGLKGCGRGARQEEGRGGLDGGEGGSGLGREEGILEWAGGRVGRA